MSSSEDYVELPGAGRALFTARSDGNMSSVAGDGAALGRAARDGLRDRIGLQRLARGYQVHGSVVRRVEVALHDEPAPDRSAEADGQATATSGIGTLVLAADCMPIALGSRRAVAMLHAGWRGVVAGVIEEGVRAVRDLAGGQQIVAVVGPCAGVCCYEVGPEVHRELAGSHRDGSHIDLRAIAHERLLAAGVAQVSDVRACTICDERYFSHRREGSRAGRQAGLAWLS